MAIILYKKVNNLLRKQATSPETVVSNWGHVIAKDRIYRK